jgi:hypothetical protein
VLRNESFYFRKYIIFEGREHFNYLIKIKNPGDSRLFAISIVHLLEHSHISSAIAVEDLSMHESRVRGLYEELEQQIG